jgi:superoxide dismutase, Cu-Zn family
MVNRWFFLAALTLLGGCTSVGEVFSTKLSAVTLLAPTKGNTVSGTINFTQKKGYVQIDGKISGLTVNGIHAIHIHEKGNCTGDGSNAGEHFNPSGSSHGAPGSSPRHAGDLGNLTADANGQARLSLSVYGISLGTEGDSVIGRAVIVHASADDLTSQPSGNAGARVACGLISKNPDRIF